MARRNRVDPWGDLHAVSPRGLFTGNRGCLVDDHGRLVRHHRGSLWISCRTQYRGWKHPLNAPRTWTPLFFLDDAVALAAGHRSCGLCRRADYFAYRGAVEAAIGTDTTMLATELNRRLAAERYRQGRGLIRAQDRVLSTGPIDGLPTGTVIIDSTTGEPTLLTASSAQRFTFHGWGQPRERPAGVLTQVLTPATSVAALANGFAPRLHSTAAAH